MEFAENQKALEIIQEEWEAGHRPLDSQYIHQRLTNLLGYPIPEPQLLSFLHRLEGATSIQAEHYFRSEGDVPVEAMRIIYVDPHLFGG